MNNEIAEVTALRASFINHLDLVDAASLWEATTDIQKEYNLGFDHSFSYENLHVALNMFREAYGYTFMNTVIKRVAMFAVHPGNAKQIKFASDQPGWDAQLVDYRDTYCLSPVKKAASAQPQVSPVKTLSPSISFALGALYQQSRQDRPNPNCTPAEVVIVSGDALLYPAMAKLAEANPNNKVSLLYFGSRIDPRWERYPGFSASGKFEPGVVNFGDFENVSGAMKSLFNGAEFAPVSKVDPLGFV